MTLKIWHVLIVTVVLVLNASLVAKERDLLDLANGAVTLSASSEYNQSWSAISMLDGTNKNGWSSANKAPFPHSFVIELADESLLTQFVIDNSNTQESKHLGISARSFSLLASVGAGNGRYRLILKGEAAQGKRQVFMLKSPEKAKKLKLLVESNWGHPSLSRIMELEVYGVELDSSSENKPINGVFDMYESLERREAGYLMRLEQRGDRVLGCYDIGNGEISAHTDGRIFLLEWREKGLRVGTATMVLSSDGKLINGLWYENGKLQGNWFGDRVVDGRNTKCKIVANDFIGKSLDKNGHIILYGIYFDSDSATIKSSSNYTLDKVLEALKKRPKLQFTIGGHTDSAGSDFKNIELSKQRSSAVAQWLVNNGVSKEQLQLRGYGESQPVAENDTPQGKALNRRVEIEVAK